ncbi:Stealth CR1 domain-containing protein [Citrobacter portucalensis]|uniref:Stealth CR1 domain-containing protein n=1 Tax=Citrobacter portucalensis TaxID=1639133 RepID=UPI00292AD984|nr:Stealth CR1 domain-containing protein [Citrobacter portucalensis]MDV0584484.1 Stealth CR1 domain-containing protein [Citrobacter portucalensis]MEB0660891.1 Stealth CR1 domain-containing protein [Citrobacter portucalensis]MEB0701275.1 Stealth CR1 domain-containing protein [Citrobacter portucalensis]
MSGIDFVVLWVDSSDLAWQASFAKHKAAGCHDEGARHPARFRDMGIFNYWFRCVEKYAPWVRKIHLVTCGQIPAWLNVNHKKLNIVFHEQFIENKYLPTFNSNAIELNIHKINDLSDKFVLFNDDMFITASLAEDFYFDNGNPNDFLILKKNPPTNKDNLIMASSDFLNISILNSHFSKRAMMQENKNKYYSMCYKRRLLKNFANRKEKFFEGFYSRHIPQPFLKSTFNEIWQVEEQLLRETVSKKFREPLCLTQYLFRYWQLANGKFNPKNPIKRGKYFNLSSKSINDAIKTLTDGTAQTCFNDTEILNDFDAVTDKLRTAFENVFSEKSGYEI